MVSQDIQLLELTDEERKVQTYLRESHPKLEDIFVKKLTPSRKSIMNRLLQALIRENLLLSKTVAFNRDGEKEILQITIGPTERITVPVVRFSGSRFEIEEEMLLWESDQIVTISSPDELLDYLIKKNMIKISNESFDRFSQELRNSVANYALALTGAEMRKSKLKKEADKHAIHSSLQWVEHQLKNDSFFSPLSFYEQWVVDGHTLHPCSKTKFGLDVSDVIAYSPEWEARPGLKMAAVHKSHCHITSVYGKPPSEWLAQEYPDLLVKAKRQLEDLHVQAEEYEWIIVHPWQFEHTIPQLFSEEISRNEIILIQEGEIPAYSLVSFRTFAPLASREEKKHHIKTAVNIQMTSAVRTVSPQSTVNGPKLSKILSEIQQRERELAQYFAMVEDRIGIYFQSSDPKDVRGKQLAAIFRENPENRVGKGEISLPGVALLAQSPITERPVIVELIEHFMETSSVTDMTEAAEEFMKEYAHICATGFLTLLCRYGISLEGHLQNSVAVFRDGKPVRMIVRDYGGIRIFKERLLNQRFEAGSVSFEAPIETNHLEEARRVLSHAVFQNHLGEMITCLVRELPVSEEKLWRAVRLSFERVFRQLKEDTNIKEAVMNDEAYFFGANMDLKALMSMRIYDEASSYEFVKISNPLYSFRKEGNV